MRFRRCWLSRAGLTRLRCGLDDGRITLFLADRKVDSHAHHGGQVGDGRVVAEFVATDPDIAEPGIALGEPRHVVVVRAVGDLGKVQVRGRRPGLERLGDEPLPGGPRTLTPRLVVAPVGRLALVTPLRAAPEAIRLIGAPAMTVSPVDPAAPTRSTAAMATTCS